MTATNPSIDALTRAIATTLAPARQSLRRAFAWRMPPELWVALMLAIAAATAPAQARAETAAAAIAEGELDTVASVTLGGTRYELTNFTCARAAQLQAEGATSKRARAYGQWLAQQPAGLKSMTLRLDNGASDGAGCYERIPGGIRVYVQGRAQPRDVIAPIVPGDPSAAGGAYDSPSELAAKAPPPARPAPAARAALEMARSDASVTDALVAGQYVYGLTAITCEAEGRDRARYPVTARDAEIAEWTRNAPGVYTRIHKDGEYDGFACAQTTPGGIRIASFWSRLPRVVYGTIVPVR